MARDYRKGTEEARPEVPTVSVIRCAAGQVLQPVKGIVIPREDIRTIRSHPVCWVTASASGRKTAG